MHTAALIEFWGDPASPRYVRNKSNHCGPRVRDRLPDNFLREMSSRLAAAPLPPAHHTHLPRIKRGHVCRNSVRIYLNPHRPELIPINKWICQWGRHPRPASVQKVRLGAGSGDLYGR